MLKLALSFFLILAVSLLVACTTEMKYRGVPEPSWHELTGEQKQLVVDQSYECDFKSPSQKSKPK